MKTLDDERVLLKPAEAIAMLSEEETIHTFRQGGLALIGADWNRKDLIKALNKYEAEVTGEQAQAMGHGLAFKDDYGYVFVETKKSAKEGDS